MRVGSKKKFKYLYREARTRDPPDRTYKAASGTHKPEHAREADIRAPVVRPYTVATVKTADMAKNSPSYTRCTYREADMSDPAGPSIAHEISLSAPSMAQYLLIRRFRGLVATDQSPFNLGVSPWNIIHDE